MNFHASGLVVLCCSSHRAKTLPSPTPRLSLWLALLQDPAPVGAIGLNVVTPCWPCDPVQDRMRLRAQDARAAPGTGRVSPHRGIDQLSAKGPPSCLQAPLGLDKASPQGVSSWPQQSTPLVAAKLRLLFQIASWSSSRCPTPHGPPGLAMRCPGLFFQQAWAGWKMTSEGGVARRPGGAQRVSWGARLGVCWVGGLLPSTVPRTPRIP